MQKSRVDATDFYLFNSLEPGCNASAILVANYVPLQDAYGGSNYLSMNPNALYEINVGNDGDTVGDVSFRLNIGIAATAADAQSNPGVAAGDLAGIANGRRPGDDVTGQALRVVMGVLCYSIALDLNGNDALGVADNLIVCSGETAADNEGFAAAGAVTFRDGAP